MGYKTTELLRFEEVKGKLENIGTEQEAKVLPNV